MQTDAPATKSPASAPEMPYSIFDKRQTWLIIALVSTAATCKFQQPRVYYCLSLIASSLRLRFKHLLSRSTDHRGGHERFHRAN